MVAAMVIAYMLLIPAYLALLCKRVRVDNYQQTLQQVREGNVLIISNHPSLIEVILIPALFWWLGWAGQGARVPWSIGDSSLFIFYWLYPPFRGIPVERGAHKNQRQNVKAVRATMKVLKRPGTVILYPEGGRTVKGEVFYALGENRVREPDISIIRFAAENDCRVLPVWVSGPRITTPESFFRGYVRLLFGTRIRLTFGTPVHLVPDNITKQSVAHLLLETAPD